MKALLILFLAVPGMCQQVRRQVVDADKCGALVDWLTQEGARDAGKGYKSNDPNNCIVYWKDPKDGRVLVLPDSITKEAAKQSMISQIQALDVKLEAGTASGAEVQQALHLVIKMLAKILKLQ